MQVLYQDREQGRRRFRRRRQQPRQPRIGLRRHCVIPNIWINHIGAARLNRGPFLNSHHFSYLRCCTIYLIISCVSTCSSRPVKGVVVRVCTFWVGKYRARLCAASEVAQREPQRRFMISFLNHAWSAEMGCTDVVHRTGAGLHRA